MPHSVAQPWDQGGRSSYGGPACSANGRVRATTPLAHQITQHLRQMHNRLDILDRHAADLMLLKLSAQDLLLGQRRRFSEETRTTIVKVIAAEPYAGQCPCCSITPVLTLECQPAPGAEFDHVSHAGLNRPEHCWLICTE